MILISEYKKIVDELYAALLNTDRIAVENIISTALTQLSGIVVVEKIVTLALDAVGDSWQLGEASLSQVYMSGVICEEVIERIMSARAVSRTAQPKIAIAVLEDQHQLGKRLVSSVVRAAGYDLLDYGAGISADNLIERVVSDKVDILLLSTLMLPSALKIKNVCERLRELAVSVKVVIGGAPFRFDQQLVNEVGADAFGYNASDVVGIIERLVRRDEY